MSAISTTSTILNQALRAAGLETAFNDRGVAQVDCPRCDAKGGMRLSIGRGQATCEGCGAHGPLLAFLSQRAQADEWNTVDYDDAEIIPIEPHLPQTVAIGSAPAPLQAEYVGDVEALPEPVQEAPPRASEPSQPDPQGRGLGETLIMTLLSLVFLCAGLAAAFLSGFANFQAFGAGVADPMQARIWGWSGVIASVCSFGGFTFFWWHMSGKRRGEAFRALVFALAGAGTSIAGTSLYMANNEQGQLVTWQQSEAITSLREADIAEWTRQLQGIPPETRSVDGLEAYLSGVEAAGRTHHKPYRDAQNELGLAKRRAGLELKIAETRADLRQSAETKAATVPTQSLPAWFFAVMLELFSSQGTSIAFVSLLLLYGARQEQKRPG